MAEEHHGGAAPGISVEAESSSEQHVSSSRGAMSREDCVEGIRSALKRTRPDPPRPPLSAAVSLSPLSHSALRLLRATPAC
jgi:hypothetical protein